MKIGGLFLALGLFLLQPVTAESALPSPPTDPKHPGSQDYPYTMKRQKIKLAGRDCEIFWPVDATAAPKPLMVFGHGQAIDIAGYDKSFEHLARKGVIVLYPGYDQSFFDQDWRRMGEDYQNIVAAFLNQFSNLVRKDAVVYSGHSKGAYIALMAAGAESSPQAKPDSLLLFEPAGFDPEWIQKIDPNIPATVTWGDKDTTTKKDLIQNIYKNLPSRFKQFIQVRSYPELPADHFFILNKSYFFGGRNGVSAFHYHGAWKWMLGATQDLEKGGSLSDPFLYGAEAASTGVPEIAHEITRN